MENFEISTVFEFHKVSHIEISNLQIYLLYVCEFGPFCPIFVFMTTQRGSQFENFLKCISKMDSKS